MIEFNHVTKTFNEKSKRLTALSDITLSIQDGEAFGVIGESGAGKSTLLRLINALEKPTSGSVSVNRINVADLSKAKLRETQKQIGMIFQQFNLLNNKTVAQNVHLPLELHHYPVCFDD
ncbi:MAG: ATP-binding cassette domain-containing protein [Alkalibacterium sp.]|nr:ATP-binding cassette domain-containing protein [Alkalibacterium sp.]